MRNEDRKVQGKKYVGRKRKKEYRQVKEKSRNGRIKEKGDEIRRENREQWNR